MDLDRRLRQAGVTPREAEVFELLASRLTNAEIADALFISVRTVESHVSALLRKLSLSDRLSLSGLARDVVGRRGKTLPLPGALADALAGAPFVGRTPELERLTDLFDAVTARGRRRLAVLTGEAGIGKTRLAAEAAARFHAGGALVLHGRCEEQALVPFQPFSEAVRPLLEGRPDPMHLAHASELGGSMERYAVFEEFDRLLASRTEPIVFVLDDAQWVDPSGLELLRHMLRHVDRSPVLVIGTARPEGVDPAHQLAAVLAPAESAHLSAVIPLRGLSPAEVQDVANRMAGASRERARSAWDRTGGNPFLVVELLRHGGDEPDLPGGAPDRIVRRVAGLGPRVFEVVAAAAVTGETFDPEVVCAALGGDVESHAAALDRARGAGFVVEDSTGAAGCRFAHSILRESLVAVVTPSHRADLHLRLAAALEGKGNPAALPEVARHRHAALPHGDPSAARRAALDAAAHAMGRFAYEVAGSCATMALDAIDAGGGDDIQRTEALLARGTAWLKAADLEVAAADFQVALQSAGRTQDRRAAARAVLGWAAASPVWGRDPELHSALERVLASGIDDPAVRATLQAKLAQVLYYEDARDRRAQLIRGAVADARANGQPETLASVLVTAHAALWGPEDVGQRTSVAHEIIAAARACGNLELEVSGLGWLAVDLLEDGDVRAADRALRRHADVADQLHQRLLLRDVELWRAMRAMLDGRFEDAARRIERARDLGDAGRDPSTETIYWVQRFWLAMEQGNPDEMDEVVEPCERMVGMHPHVPAWRAALAMVHARRGDAEAARRHFEPLARDRFAALPRDFVWLNAMTYLAETCAFLADARRARDLTQMLHPYADRIVVIDRALACKGSVLRFLGLLAATSGDAQAAERYLARALERHEAMGVGPLTDRTLRDLGAVKSRSLS